MLFKYLLPVFFILMCGISLPAQAACDEECRRCVGPVCANDPVCEARKAACNQHIVVPHPPISPPMPTAQDIQHCIANLNGCPAYVIAKVSYAAVQPVVDGYIGYLQQQAGGHFFSIDPSITSAIQTFYSVNLQQVRYAININTIHGANITIGNTIYFTSNINFSDPSDAKTLFHELEHVVQYANRGGVQPFMSEYILKAGGSILRGGNSIDIHDNIDLENAANAKASQVSSAVGLAPTGSTPQPGTVSSATKCNFPTGGFCWMNNGTPVGAPCVCNGGPMGMLSGVAGQ